MVIRMPQQSVTTHVILHKQLVLYRRERSEVWQCRYKVGGAWLRASTKQVEFERAKQAAQILMIEAEIRLRAGLPIITKNFKHVAQLATQRMEQELANGSGKITYTHYVAVINRYLIPILGKHNVTSIDASMLELLDAARIKQMGKQPSKSTLLTHNAALNRVFDEAVARGFMTELKRPKLSAESGKKGKPNRRPAFTVEEIKVMMAEMRSWIDSAPAARSKETRQLLFDYVSLLLETGARPGKELLNLKWKQVQFAMHPIHYTVNNFPPNASIPGLDVEERTNLQRTCELTVDGKTGMRNIIGGVGAVLALSRVASRNYKVRTPVTNPFEEVSRLHGGDFVLRMKRTKEDVSPVFHHMFEEFLLKIGLLVDANEQKRVFYSLRHTYATMMLTYDKVNIHILAVQMGTSVGMIEKHYSHLRVKEAIEQLRGKESRKQLKAN
jgi:integrase